ncbi:hypothetical protein NQ317_009662 [Molorchus minor]|uniref:GCF C-terminal domain-containing protein n=1 Tax=Molorchus minor TaxID=1323400 RepID=A0ABQ9JKM8_9CUCU|nr:hypothetical protein NQ317_009662 [Molorchus minor]
MKKVRGQESTLVVGYGQVERRSLPAQEEPTSKTTGAERSAPLSLSDRMFQRRVFTENDDEDEPMEVQEIAPIEKKPKPKKKDKSSTKQNQTLLSFDAEEEEKRKKDVKQEKEEIKIKEKTEIVTDDFVLVVNSSHKKPSTPPPPILTGQAALCAGKDEPSSEEEEEQVHRFSKPNSFKKILESGAIPDAAMIHAARKKRQRARELGDFVPVEDEEPEDKGRLMRDDDNEGSDEERLDMDVNLNLRDQERRREQFLAAQESDHEVDEWEDQQIRKGVTGAAISMAQEMLYPPECPPAPRITTQVPVMEPGIPRTPQMIAEKLREHFQNRVQEDIQQTTIELEELKIKAPTAAQRFRFYQELRGYITDLVECLDEKVGIISNLEQRAMDLMARKSEWLIERRRQDVRDQAEEATSKGVMLLKGLELEEKQRRAAEREGRRTRRRRARETPGQPKHVEGMSSDDEISQQDILNFDKEKEQIDSELQEVFEDVVEDYSSTANILIKFEQWRSTDLTAYTEAYATFCLPKVVSPLVRLNLVFWDPLNETMELEKLPWYRTLALYGLHDDETEETLALDPDISLLPTIIEKVIVPKLTQLVDKCWDPLSSSQTLRLVGIVSRYIRRFPSLGPASAPLHNLFADSKSPFFQRQFSSGLKLLKNITSWQGILNDNTLKELALTSLLNRYLLSALKFCVITDAVQKVRLISLILPRIWLQGSTPEFKMFSVGVLNLHQQLDKDNPMHLEPIETLNSIIKTLRSQNQ